ncbi:hypothetical protein LguiA_023301 [Lonicera macranthoides]
MSRIWGKIAGLFTNRTFAGMDKAGNRYFARKQEVDGVMKEKRWVKFKSEDDPTSIPVEWICWLNGQRKRAPTPEEMAEMEARRECVRLNVALLKKEEEERRAKEGSCRKVTSTGKVGGPDLKSFIQQFPDSKGDKIEAASDATGEMRSSKETGREEKATVKAEQEPESSEPTGSGQSYRPGTWQPPT